jgi:hypothetical protein
MSSLVPRPSTLSFGLNSQQPTVEEKHEILSTKHETNSKPEKPSPKPGDASPFHWPDHAGASQSLHGYRDPSNGRASGPAQPNVPEESVVGPGRWPGRTESPYERLGHPCTGPEMRPKQGRVWVIGSFCFGLVSDFVIRFS